jgi:ribosomal protein S18 acetylase RimI-like enzyme
MIEYRRMQTSEIDRIAEIDRSEYVTRGYVFEHGELKAIDVEWNVPRWFAEGDHEHTVPAKIQAWKPYLEQGATMFGAFDGELLAGFAILRPKLTEEMAQLAVLHVSREHRRQGIATTLTEIVCDLAVELGAKEIYVSATPSQSAVGFYQSQGFRLVDKVNKELYELEPEDIHLIKTL